MISKKKVVIVVVVEKTVIADFNMDLSRCHNGGGLASGLVFPRHPTSSPPSSDMLSKNGKKEVVGKNGSSGSSAINPKTAFFSISNLVNGLRQQQEKGKTTIVKAA